MTNAPPLQQAPRQAFVTAMRDVAHSVSVITTGGVAGSYGATVTAFNSVSADPPMVLVCVNANSRIAKAVTGNGVFCVNILPEGASDVAARFAGRDDAHVADRFEGIAHSGAVPALEGTAQFHCDLESAAPAGSHLVLMGRVHSVTAAVSAPLIYLAGEYGKVTT